MRRVHAVAAAALVLTGGNAFARDLLVPRKFKTIEAASAVAQPGDRIVVRGRVRHGARLLASDVTLDLRRARVDGALTVSGDRSTVQGGDLRRGLFVDGDGATIRGAHVRGMASGEFEWSGAATVTVAADDVTLDSLVMNQSDDDIGVLSSGARTEVSGSDVGRGMICMEGEEARVVDNHSALIGVYAPGAEVRGNVVNSPYMAIHSTADDSTIAENVVRGGGIVCEGGSPVVEDNDVSSADSDAITVSDYAGGATVSGNAVRVAGAGAISIRGDDATVEDNTIAATNAGTAVNVTGDGVSVLRNDVVRDDAGAGSGWGGGFSVSGDYAVVRGNSVDDRSRGGTTGVFVDGVSNLVSDNVVHGGTTGITVCGGFDSVLSNEVGQVAADGVVVTGDKSVVEDTVVSDAGGSGVLLFSPIDVRGGTVSGCGMGGVVLLQGGCLVADCSLSSNFPVDVIADPSVSTTGLAPTTTVATDPTQFPELVAKMRGTILPWDFGIAFVPWAGGD